MKAGQIYLNLIGRFAAITEFTTEELMHSRKFPCPYYRGRVLKTLRMQGFLYREIYEATGFNTATVQHEVNMLERLEDNPTLLRVREVIDEYEEDLNEKKHLKNKKK
jgi:hypothetical protein